MKKLIIILIVGALGFIYWVSRQEPSSPGTDGQQITVGGDAVESAELSPVGDFVGIGVSGRTWDGTTFAASINADIDPPASGTSYVGWLVLGDEYVSMGRLEPNAIGYGVSFTADRDLRDHTGVIVSVEQGSGAIGDSPSGTRVLEGSY